VPISQEEFARIAKDLPGMGNDPHAVRARVEALEKILERAFFIPGTKIPFSMFLDDKVYDLYIRYVGKQEIETKYGKFRVIKIRHTLAG
jgi:hypothetical protein